MTVSVRLCAWIALAAPLGAQETRSMIFGRVTDPQASAVAAATVTVTHTGANTTQTLRTNETGYYEANLLLPGPYQVTAEAAGFKRTIRTNIVLPSSSRVQVDVPLEIGALAETVSVTSEAPLLETNTVTGGIVMDNRSITDLPIARYNPTLLMGFTPGLQMRGGYRTTSHFAATILVENLYLPNKVSQNEMLIDGVPNVGGGRRIAFIPSTEALQEFKIEVTNFDASVGHSAGASISMMTKAGTNQLHGSLTEQHMQQRLNATPFFLKQAYYRSIAQAMAAGNQAQADAIRSRSPQQPGRSNNYSVNVGGPIVLPKLFNGRNKLFFFVGFNGTNERLTEATDNINVTLPSLANRQGDFSRLLQSDATRFQIYDPLTVRADPARPTHFIRDPFAGNIVPSARVINPAYAAYAKMLPTPNNEPVDARQQPLNNYIATAMPWSHNYYAISNRVDYQHSSAHRFFMRWSWSDYDESRSDWTYTTTPGLQDTGVIRHNIGGTVDWVWSASPTTVIDSAFSVNEYRSISGHYATAQSFKPTDVGLPAYLDAKAGDQALLPLMSLPGYRNIGQTLGTFTRTRFLAWKSDLSRVWSKHSLRAGFDTRQQFLTGGGGGNTSGQFTFNNTYTRRNDDTFTPAGDLGHTWAAFMLGIPTAATIDTNDSYAVHSPAYGWYVQDNWRITPKLTLNPGLRMEFETGPTERYNRMIGHFDPSLALPISAAAQAAYARSPIPELAASNFVVKGGTIYPGVGGASRNLFRSQLMWQPRFSAAYQMNANTVLRAGYGVSHDTLAYIGPNQFGFSRTTSTVLTNDFGQTWLAGNPGRGISPLTDPFPVRSDGTRFDAPVRDALGAMAQVGRSFSYRRYDMEHPRQQRWRVGVQRQIGRSMMVEAAYAGAYSDHVSAARPQTFLPGNYWADGLTRNNAIATNLTSNVTNPFSIANFASLQRDNPAVYQNMSTLSFFTSPTIQKQQLLRIFPAMTGLTDSGSPDGRARSDELNVSFSKRFTSGFNLNLNYIRLRARERDFYSNEYDALPTWRDTIEGAPNRFTATTLFEVPFGKNKRWLNHGILGRIAGNFEIGATYEYQTGQLLDFGNLFYYGQLSDIPNVTNKTLDHWFNTDNFETNASRAPAAYHNRVFPTRVDGVRWDMVNDWNLNVQKIIPIGDRWRLQFRFDAIDALNRTVFGPPGANPLASDFARITSQTETPNRTLYFSGKIQF